MKRKEAMNNKLKKKLMLAIRSPKAPVIADYFEQATEGEHRLPHRMEQLLMATEGLLDGLGIDVEGEGETYSEDVMSEFYSRIPHLWTESFLIVLERQAVHRPDEKTNRSEGGK